MTRPDTIRPQTPPRNENPVFLDYDEAASLLRTSKRTLQRKVAAGEFIKPLYITERTVVFPEHEVRQWMWDQVEARANG